LRKGFSSEDLYGERQSEEKVPGERKFKLFKGIQRGISLTTGKGKRKKNGYRGEKKWRKECRDIQSRVIGVLSRSNDSSLSKSIWGGNLRGIQDSSIVNWAVESSPLLKI